MALIKTAQQEVSCPNCKSSNPQGSPYCARCGAPLGELSGPSALAAPPSEISSRFSSGPLHPETPHFQDSFLTEGQDPALAKTTFERATGILISGETIEYVATANRVVGHMPDCVVVTSKRVMLYKKRTFGKLELDDMFWRDLEGVQMKEGRNGVLLIFDSIQGWQIIAENLPKSQAWRLHELALKFGERLAGKAQENQPTQVAAVATPVAAPVVASTPAQQVARPQAPVAQPAPAAPSAPSAPRQYIYAAQAAQTTAQPAQVAAFHSSPPAQSEVVVFDSQPTQPVLRVPAETAPAAAPVHAPAPQRPNSGPLANQQPTAAPAPARQPVPANGATAHPATPVKATGPLPFGQPAPHTPGAAPAQPKLGSGPLSSRLSQAPTSTSPRLSAGAPISAPLGEPPTSQDDLVRKMKQLKDMLEADLITREDYEAKKAEILGRL